MKPDLPPRRFDEELGKSEFSDVQRLRRRNVWTGTIVSLLLLLLFVAGIWYIFRRVSCSQPPAQEQEEEPVRDLVPTYPPAEPDTE